MKSPSLSLWVFSRCSRPLWTERELRKLNTIPQNAPFRILSDQGKKTESVMEEHIPAPNSDPEYRTELTPTLSNSAASSSIALRTCAHATPGTSTEWTNEKHRLYIDSLETSFVHKLHHSMRLRDCHPQMNVQGTHSSQELPFTTYNSSGQFMVARDRRFQKNNFSRNETPLESTADSHVTLESPWICHFTAAGKSCNVAYPNLQEHIVSSNKGTSIRRKPTLKEMRVTARSSERNLECHQGSVGSTTEVSGQNFVEEDHRGKLSCEFIPKRFKRASADASSNDQLVPLRNFDTNEVSMAHNAAEGDEQGHHQRLSEHPESFICAKTIFTVS